MKTLASTNFKFSGLPGGLLGSLRGTGPSGSHDDLRHGPAADGALAQSERDPERRAQSGFQDRRRQRHAAARSQRSCAPCCNMSATTRRSSKLNTATFPPRASARSSAACWRWKSRAATNFSASRRSISTIMMQTDGQGRGMINVLGCRQAHQCAEALRDVFALAAVGIVRAAAGSRRSGETEAGIFLRRGAFAFQRRAEGVAGKNRAGGSVDPFERRRRLLRARKIRSTFPTSCSASSAIACSMRCARSRRAIKRR